jgi:hypothetical protein
MTHLNVNFIFHFSVLSYVTKYFQLHKLYNVKFEDYDKS